MAISPYYLFETFIECEALQKNDWGRKMRIYDFDGSSMGRERRKETVQNKLSSPWISAVLSLAAVIAIAEAVWGQSLASGWRNVRVSGETQTVDAVRGGDFLQNHLGFASLLDVSHASSAYLEAAKRAAGKLEDFMKDVYEELEQEGVVSYGKHEEAVRQILESIDEMESLHVLRVSPLTDFEEYCGIYYQRIADYFETVQRNDRFDRIDYNAMADWMRETTSPYDKLKEVFDENAIPYSLEYDDDGRECIVYTVSSIGTF